MHTTIRKGTPTDVPALLTLIRELAVYEREPDAVRVTEADLLEHGFGNPVRFEFLVAEVESEVVGIALYYPKYSTWRGPCLYLEDLIVTTAHRKQGIGARLLDAVWAEAEAAGMDSVQWQVLDWNEPSIDFYRKAGADMDATWINVRLAQAPRK